MILVCGEALVDLFVSESANGDLETKAVLGGSPFNVAIGLSRLGQKVAFCGGLSEDYFGAALSKKLKAEGVDLNYSVQTPRLSTISVVATDETGHPSYAFHGEGKADRQLTQGDLSRALSDDIKAITFGSYTIAVSPVKDAYLALAAREAGRRIISLDPNVRPTVTPDMAEWRSNFEAMLRYADIVKASEEDLYLAYGSSVNVAALVTQWHEAGARLVLVTHGPGGATGFLQGYAPISVDGRAVEVVDTVGAGDTFHAAVLAYLSEIDRLTPLQLPRLTIDELHHALTYAITASSITCTRQGADVPHRDEVLRLLPQAGQVDTSMGEVQA